MIFLGLRAETERQKLYGKNDYVDCLARWLSTPVVRCLVESETRRGHHQKEHGDTYLRILDAATKQLIGNITEFVKYCAWEEVTVKEDGLGTERRRRAVMGMLRTKTSSSLWTLSLMRVASLY